MRRALTTLLLAWALGLLPGCSNAARQSDDGTIVRFATFNASLNREKQGQLVQDLSGGNDQQIRNVAEIIQRARPDVLLINEFDHDEKGAAPALFQQNYLSVSQNGAKPIEYPFRVFLPVNTGVNSGFDLDNDGVTVTEPGSRGYGNDCFGFGQFPGQYGMLLLSKYPFEASLQIRTFQTKLWKEMPGAMLPTNADGSPWYSDAELAVFRLSSKSHWDVALQIKNRAVHIFASHPTPPAFDGPEDRNGKRNHDEIRLWADYLNDNAAVPPDESFIILGDLNADPNDGGSVKGAIQQLLDNPRVNSTFIPTSEGAVEAAVQQAGKNLSHSSKAEYDTADFGDGENGPGNLRCDYALPSKNLKVLDGGVFWPVTADPLSRLVRMEPTVASSDHRLVWMDIAVGAK